MHAYTFREAHSIPNVRPGCGGALLKRVNDAVTWKVVIVITHGREINRAMTA